MSCADACSIIAARSRYGSSANGDITAGSTISTADTCSIIAARSSNRSTLNDNITTVPRITTTDSCTTNLAYNLERAITFDSEGLIISRAVSSSPDAWK